MTKSLLDIAIGELGRALCCCDGLQVDLALIPEDELAQGVWDSWQQCLRTAAAAGHPPPVAAQHQVLLKFAFAFWRPRLLRIAYSPPAPLPGLASMHLVAARLQHLELSAPALLSLEPFAAALPQLCCLSLRGCSLLRDGTLSSLCRLTTLRALDLGGLAALSDAAVFHVARLPQLAALNLSGTAAGDASLQFLTYGHRVGAWQAAAGVAALPPEAAAWPPLPLEHVQLAGTRVTPAGLAELAHLPKLRFLDVRRTGAPRSALGPLQRRFGLQSVQAAVLTDSNLTAVAAVNEDAVVCRCGCVSFRHGGDTLMQQAAASDLQGWKAEGVRLLLHFDPTAGVGGLLAGSGRGLSSHQAQACGQGGQRAGYRQPRDTRRGETLLAAPVPPPPPLQQHYHHGGMGRQKRPLPWE